MAKAFTMEIPLTPDLSLGLEQKYLKALALKQTHINVFLLFLL